MPAHDTPEPQDGKEVKKTARNSRRLVPTGTVADVLTLLPEPVAGARPINGPALAETIRVTARTGPVDRYAYPDTEPTDPVEETTRRMYQRIGDRDVLRARATLRETGVVEFLDTLISDTKTKTAAARTKTGKTKRGRPARVTVEALLVAMWLAANTNRPMLLTEFSDILFHCITPSMRRMMNVSDGVVARSTIPTKFHRWDRSAARAVGAAFTRMTAVVDPSDEITSRANVLWADMRYRGLTDADAQQFQAHLDWVCNQLVHVTYLMLPESVRTHDDGDRCFDATHLQAPARVRNLDDPQASSMPRASTWAREGDHSGQPEPGSDTESGSGSGSKRRRGKMRRSKNSKVKWALDLHLMVAVDTTPGDRQYLPALITSMTVDRAAIAPADNARRLIASELQRGFTPGYATGDGLYAKAAADTFQIPAREAGYKVILPILDSTSGVQGSHESGMLLANGTYYCPAMPDHLRTIVDDYRARRIDHPTFAKRIQARIKFEMVTKQKPDQRGVGERLGCRAANHSLTVACAHKPASTVERTTLDRDGDPADHRPRINLPIEALTNGQPPTICQKQAVTVTPEDGAKFRQAIPIGDEHTDIYNRLRQSHEGMNGFAKDEAKEALGAPGRRHIRTKVAKSMFAAFLTAAANIRKIRSFLAHAQYDANGDLYVERTKRKGKHARTGNLPGAANPDSQAPPEDTEAA